MKVTGKDIKNRSIKRIDIKRNTLTGGEIREARLGKVPAAARADLAGTATAAGSAGTADSAATAANASLLEGLGASAFARAGQIDSGSGDNTATSQTTLVSFPEIGLEIRTDGDADATNQLRLVNTRESGTYLFWSTGMPLALGTLEPHVNAEVAGPGTAPLNHDIVLGLKSGANSFEPAPVVSITCRFSVPPTVVCIGIRSA